MKPVLEKEAEYVASTATQGSSGVADTEDLFHYGIGRGYSGTERS